MLLTKTFLEILIDNRTGDRKGEFILTSSESFAERRNAVVCVGLKNVTEVVGRSSGSGNEWWLRVSYGSLKPGCIVITATRPQSTPALAEVLLVLLD